MTNSSSSNNFTGGFAAIMLVILGFFNLIHGFELLHKSAFFESKFITSNADTWGWIFIVFAVLQLVAGLWLFTSPAARTIGIIVSSLAMLLWFTMLFAAPFAALVGLALNFSILMSILGSEGPAR